MATTSSLQQYGRVPASINLHRKQQHSLSNCSSRVSVMAGNRNVMLLQGFIKNNKVSKRRSTAGLVVKCGGGMGLGDFIGGDLVKFDIGQWLSDVEEHKALAIYPPHEGGYEGRYLNRLIRQGYYFLDLKVDFRLEHLPPDAKGLVVWIIEAKVLSKAELQFLALLPTLRPNVRVVAECGNWRKLVWKPLKEIAGLTAEGA
uniref:NAD(P)H-quinone oxidoreductase subunit N, chloroplastic n=1 Tax=Salix viminalis TaxID=40686 RepID=A0A6N2LMA5_SALVM